MGLISPFPIHDGMLLDLVKCSFSLAVKFYVQDHTEKNDENFILFSPSFNVRNYILIFSSKFEIWNAIFFGFSLASKLVTFSSNTFMIYVWLVKMGPLFCGLNFLQKELYSFRLSCCHSFKGVIFMQSNHSLVWKGTMRENIKINGNTVDHTTLGIWQNRFNIMKSGYLHHWSLYTIAQQGLTFRLMTL